MILITGASSGIGEACARAFAKEKKDLFLVARRLNRLECLARELSQLYGVRVLTAAIDVCDREQIKALTKSHSSDFSEIDVLVNNAGLASGLDTFQEGNESDWDQMIATNISGVLSFTQAVLPFFIKKNAGHIIMMGSVAARWMYPKGNVYSASKAAIHAFAESLRLDLLGTKIRVTTVAPGMVETEFSQVRFKGD